MHGWCHCWWERSGDEMDGGSDGGFFDPWMVMISMDGEYT